MPIQFRYNKFFQDHFFHTMMNAMDDALTLLASLLEPVMADAVIQLEEWI